MPDVIPFLTYEDGIAALEWLAECLDSRRQLASRLPMGGCLTEKCRLGMD
jgi:hypothetical protein